MTKLPKIREDRGLSQTELAAKAGLSVSTIYKMEAGKYVARKSQAKVARVLRVPISEIEAPDDTPSMAHS